MSRITSLVIENFQSHLHSTFEFGDGLNVIVGPSDSGKSAVLRALRWVLYNEPRGTEFVRAGARECRVRAVMSDGSSILRELLISGKAGTQVRHRYVIERPGTAPQVLEGFGHALPAEVVRAHGMPEVVLDTDKKVLLGFGSQLEGPFLLTETGSTRARAIGRLLGVHVVDAAAREAQRDLKNLRQEVGRLERELRRLDQELAPFSGLDGEERRLSAAEHALALAEAQAVRLRRLEAIRLELEQSLAAEVRLEAAVDEMGEQSDRADAVLGQVEGLQRRLTLLQRLAGDLRSVEQRLTTEADALAAADAALQAQITEYGALLTRLGKCPTCLQPIGADALERIVGDLAGGAPPEHRHE